MKKTTSAEIFSAKAQRIFSTVLVLLAAVLVLTAPVGAVDAWDGVSEDGSWYNPIGQIFTIMNGSQLSNFSKLVNAGTDFTGKTVMLGADIDLDNKEWTPIGNTNSSGKYFNGTFNGNGKAITGLNISTASTDTQGYFGLFGYVGSGGVIQNLHVSGIIDVEESETNYAGGLVGYFEGGIIENCSSAVTVTLKSNSAGSDESVYSGGIAGSLSGGTIKNCYSYISGNPIWAYSSNSYISIYAGGIVGAVKSNGLVENCYATGGVAANHYNSGTCYAGGIVGAVESNGLVENCYALNKYVQATSIDSSNQPTNDAYYGRVAGYVDNTNCLVNNYAWGGMTYIGNIITGDDGANQKNGESKSSNDFWGKTTLSTIFNDESVWKPYTTNDKFQLPILKNLPEPTNADASYLSPSSGGQGGSTSENNNGGGSSAIILSSTSKYRDTVKAEFKEITFDANGGVGYMEGQQLPVGEAGTLNYNEFSYEGYEFVGWALEPTGLVVYADGEEVTIQGDVTLYAVWVQPIPEIPDVPEPVDTPMPVAGMILGLFGAALILRRK